MDLKEIVAISGKPGLYKVVAATNRGILVESIDDKKAKMPVNASQQVASLDEITIYTPGEESITLKSVFEKINEKTEQGTEVPNAKDNPVSIKEFFGEVAPGYDADRVYISDMKKVLKWYEMLKSHNII